MGYPSFYNHERIEKILQEKELTNPGFMSYRNKLGLYYSKKDSIESCLLHAYIETNSACNYACPSCTHGNNAESSAYNSAGYMSQPLFIRVVDQLHSLGCCSLSLYNCNEPLLDKSIFERLDYCRNKFFDVVLMTNGSLLTSEHTQHIIESPVTRICFSIDANSDETYSIVRPSRNQHTRKSYQEVKASIIALVETLSVSRPDIITRASFVVSPKNSSEATSFLDEWSKIVDIVELQDYHALPYNAQNVFESDFFHPIDLHSCGAPFTTMQIRPDGKVYPCCTMYATYKYDKEPFDLCIGDVSTTELSDIWSCEKMQKVRSSLSEGVPLRACADCMKSHYVDVNLHEDNVLAGFRTD
jgi:radical SAM protein with 4Fe4S-binding SPASM domain